jgi:hypothetical protein
VADLPVSNVVMHAVQCRRGSYASTRSRGSSGRAGSCRPSNDLVLRPVPRERHRGEGAAPRRHLADRGVDDAEGVIGGLFPSALVIALVEVQDLEAFGHAWEATRRNAVAVGNPVVASAACVLLDAAERGALVEGVISVEGASFEVWVDTTRSLLLTAVARPDLDRPYTE